MSLQRSGDALQLQPCSQRELGDVFTETLEVEALPVEERRRNDGDPNRATQRPRQVEQRRTIGSFTRLQPGQRQRANRSEQERQRSSPQDLQEDQVSVARVRVDEAVAP